MTGVGRLVLAVWMASACAADAPVVLSTVRDSAGVRVTEHGSLVDLPTIRTEGEPSWTIGVMEGDESQLLHGVASGVVLPSGEVALLNSGTNEVRIYTSGGSLRARQGGTGDGPGEYQNPASMVLGPGDSLVVWDSRHLRVNVLGPDATFARSFTPTEDLGAGAMAGVFTNGDVLLVAQSLASFDPAQDDLQQMFGVELRYGPNGESLAELGRRPWRRMQILVATRERVEVAGLVFDPQTVRSVAGDLFWVGTARAHEIQAYDPDGALRAIVRWPGPDLMVTEADKERHVADLVADAPSEEARANLLRGASVRAYADAFPAYADLRVDADGRMWVQAYRRPGDAGPDRWLVLDSQGTAQHWVELPARSLLLWASGDDVLLRTLDELDVERVELRTVAGEP